MYVSFVDRMCAFQQSQVKHRVYRRWAPEMETVQHR